MARGGVRLSNPLLGARSALAREAIAQAPGMPPSSLAALATDANMTVRQAAAWNPETSLEDFLHHKGISVFFLSVARFMLRISKALIAYFVDKARIQ